MAKSYCFFSSFPKQEREVILFRQAKSLLSDGFDVTAVISDIKEDLIDRGVKFVSTGYKPSSTLKRWLVSPRKIYKKLLEVDADVYHTVNIDQLITCLWLKKKGKKIYFEMQEDHPYSLLWKSKLPQWMLKPIVSLMAKFMGYILKQLDIITAVSYDTTDYLKCWGIPAEKVYTIGNFPEIQKDYELTLDDYVRRNDQILYFGIVYSYSRQEVFLEALNNIHGINYLVAGRFMGNEVTTYKQLIENNPIWKERVTFVNGFKHDELAGFIKSSTICNVLRDFSAYSHDKKGSFGIIKIFESMENALPIICADMPIYREIMKEYKCGILVDPMNPKQIENAIRYLMTHKEEAWKMGQEGRRAVIEKYSWDALSVKYLKAINALIENLDKF